MKRLIAACAITLMGAFGAPVGASSMNIAVDAPAAAHLATRLGDNPPPDGDPFMAVPRRSTPLARA